MWSPAVFLIIAIFAIGLFALVAIILRGKHKHHFDVEEYQTRWLKIENNLVKGDPRTYSMAVINADKLLDKALQEMGVSGKTMGERMKRIGNHFSELNRVWYAHKLRNQIAHEEDFEISYAETSKALAAFRQALKDLGAI